MSKRTILIRLLRCYLLVAVTIQLLAAQACVLGATPGVNGSDPPPRPLVPDQSIEVELRGGDSHSYSLAMESGEYLYLTVDQMGIDVVAEWLEASGGIALRVDSPNGAQGAEEIWFIAERSGVHRLKVSAAADVPAGRYSVSLRDMRSAQPADRLLAQAASTFNKAEQLRLQGGSQEREASLQTYRQSLAQWRDAGGNALQEIYALKRISDLEGDLGRREDALRAVQEALSLASQNDLRWMESILLTDIGFAFRQLSEFRMALAFYKMAQDLSSQVGNHAGLNRVAINLAVLYRNMGRVEQALALYRELLDALGEDGDAELRQQAWHSFGVAYQYTGLSQEGLDAFQESLEICQDLGLHSEEGDLLVAMGWTSYLEGDAKSALDYYSRAVRLYEDSEVSIKAFVFDRQGTAYRVSGRLDEALDAYERALAIAREEADTQDQANTLVNLGQLHLDKGEARQALAYSRQALDLLGEEEIPNARREAHFVAAQAERHLDRLPQARVRIEEALGIVEETRLRTRRLLLERTFNHSRYLYYDFYFDLLMQMHEGDPEAGFEIAALEALEGTRSQTLLQSLAETRALVGDAARFQVIDEVIAVQNAVSVTQQERRQASTPEEKSALERELRELLMRFDQLRRQSSPAAAEDETRAQPLRLSQMQDLLDSQTQALVYALGERRSYLWVVDHRSVSSHVLPVGRDAIGLAVQSWLKTVGRRLPGMSALQGRLTSETLSRQLLEPVAEQLGKKRLLIVGDGILQSLPFAALPDPRTLDDDPKPLIFSHEIAVLPSLSSLVAMRALKEEPADGAPVPGSLAVFADPVFGASEGGEAVPPASGPASETAAWPRLPFTRTEAEAILKFFPEEKRFAALGFDATRDIVFSGVLSRYEKVHFATHAQLDSAIPELSSVVLSMVDAEGSPVDGLLKLHEIYDLELKAELVVLSACQTALGPNLRGEGLVGLTQGFMHAEVPRLVVSLWKVDDKSTAELMKRFYRNMQVEQMAPSAAMRAAQLEMVTETPWSAPYHWAGFVFYGEWLSIR